VKSIGEGCLSNITSLFLGEGKKDEVLFIRITTDYRIRFTVPDESSIFLPEQKFFNQIS
jgi:hypothetical protein